jgi:hypothetical protein
VEIFGLPSRGSEQKIMSDFVSKVMILLVS